MDKPRFKVATVSGYRTMGESFQRHGPGVTAHVLDTHNCHRVVASFRSEDSTGTSVGGVRLNQSRRRGRDATRPDAERVCAELNAAEARGE